MPLVALDTHLFYTVGDKNMQLVMPGLALKKSIAVLLHHDWRLKN
jgi:hypothetical protein